MDLKEIDVNMRNWVEVDSTQDRDYWKCGIDPPGSISHRVSQLADNTLPHKVEDRGISPVLAEDISFQSTHWCKLL